jgi:magnesium transporter
MGRREGCVSNKERTPTGSTREGEALLGDLAAESSEGIASRLEEAHPADAAPVLSRFARERAAEVAEYLDPKTAGLLFREMHPALAAAVVAEMEAPEGAMVLGEMAPDDRVDILNHLPTEIRQQLVRELDSGETAEVRRLASYPDDSAGGIMTTEVVALPEAMMAEQAVAELRRIGQEVEQVYYVYAVDASGRLTGVLSMRDLIFAPPDRTLESMKRADVVSVPVSMDQEDVARVLRRYGYLALPVVDDGQRLLGIITADDLADVVEEEATEDIQKIGGTQALHAPYFEVGLVSMLRKRGGWLAVLFLGEMCCSSAKCSPPRPWASSSQRSSARPWWRSSYR